MIMFVDLLNNFEVIQPAFCVETSQAAGISSFRTFPVDNGTALIITITNIHLVQIVDQNILTTLALDNGRHFIRASDIRN